MREFPLYSHSHTERGSFRWWLVLREPRYRDLFKFSMSWRTFFLGASIDVDDEDWTLFFGLALVSFRFSVPSRGRRWDQDRELGIRYHNGALWWNLWTPKNSWSSTTPRWRNGNFNFVDFALGRSKCEHRTLEARDVLVPMPERAYAAKAELQEWTWRRPRWFAKTIKRVQIDVPSGIPFPGKGENSWDCGDDATFGITTGECRSIAEGVGVLVGSVLNDRVRHGGWDCWAFRATERAAQ